MNTINKVEELGFFNEEWNPQKTENFLTPIQAINILNELLLKYDFEKEDLDEIEILKKHLKNR